MSKAVPTVGSGRRPRARRLAAERSLRSARAMTDGDNAAGAVARHEQLTLLGHASRARSIMPSAKAHDVTGSIRSECTFPRGRCSNRTACRTAVGSTARAGVRTTGKSRLGKRGASARKGPGSSRLSRSRAVRGPSRSDGIGCRRTQARADTAVHGSGDSCSTVHRSRRKRAGTFH